jgi:predicted acyl esterase
VRRIDHIWIPLRDGTRLAARVWLPHAADSRPVPALLEYLPYRKGDAFAVRDSRHHPYFASHGYAAVRVDLRGTGDSDGILGDEYLPLEQADGVEVIEWLAAQPWCSGAVGMLGISWGGFNGLQIAALRPPSLGAVVSMCASDDRYSDDVHYKGGCVLGVDMLQWAATMLTSNALPPDPAAVGDGWRETWLERLEKTPPFVEAWMSHQRRDDYWRQGSVCEDHSAIEAAVWAVGGWSDGYSNAVPRLVAGLPGPRKGLIGPWSHAFPQDGSPGPAIGFLRECVRFFDHWLKGQDAPEVPRLQVWLQDPVRPADHYAERPGRWVTDPVTDSFGFDLGPLPAIHASPLATGSDAGAWCPDGGAGDWPPDQRAEDARSLSLDLAPLDEPLEIVGFPEARLSFAVDRPNALVAVRLCAVAPDGSSLLVTRGLLNLTHRDGHADPQPLRPGRVYDVAVELDGIAQVIPAGHHLRLAISTNYWPWAWPSPEPATLTLNSARLVLPLLSAEGPPPAPFGPPESCEPLAVETLTPGRTSRTHSHDPATGTHEIRFEWDVGGHRRLVEHGTEMDDTNVTTYRITDGDPLSAEVHVRCTSALGRDAWRTRVETDSRMTSTATEFHITQRLDAYEGDEPVFTRAWDLVFPRDLV